MYKKVTLVEPYQFGFLPFQRPIFETAREINFETKSGYNNFPRFCHYFLHHWPVNFRLPFASEKDSKLLLVSATHPGPMIFPYAYRNEIIPVFWDCWPKFRKRIVQILKMCNVNICFFTQEENVDYFKRKFPRIKIFFLPEAICTKLYHIGPELSQRDIDVLEYGRSNGDIHTEILKIEDISHVYPKEGEMLFDSFDSLTRCIADSKIAIAYPRSMTEPHIACGLETLTQRYWECMYSGTLMIGHAPAELVKLVGYNPVIEIGDKKVSSVVKYVLAHLEDFQQLSCKNMEVARRYGDWNHRLLQLKSILYENGYNISKE